MPFDADGARPFFRFPTIRTLSLILAALILAACTQGAESDDLDSARIERGKLIYATYCAACHGRDGEGEPNWKTPNEDGTYPAPPHTGDGHTWHHGDGLLFQIIQSGGDSLNIPKFQSNMPAFGEVLSDEEIIAVLAYIKSLWPEEQRQFQSEVSQQDPFP